MGRYSKARALLKVMLVLASFCFIARILIARYMESRLEVAIFNAWSLMASFVLLLSIFFLGALGWKLLLRALNVTIDYQTAARMWIQSLLSKYLPGGSLTYVLSRTYISSTEGVSARVASFAALLEMVFILEANCLVFALSLLVWPDPLASAAYWFAFAVVPFGLGALHPRLFVPAFNWWLNIRREQPFQAVTVRYRTMLALVGFHCFHWLLFGTAFYLLVNAFWPMPLSSIPVFVGIYAVACAAGMLAIFAPNGLGVRELALTGLLSIFIPPHVAAALALLARLWYVLGEIGSLVFVFGIAFSNRLIFARVQGVARQLFFGRST